MERASQWDIRINVPTEDDVAQVITNIQLRYETDNVSSSVTFTRLRGKRPAR